VLAPLSVDGASTRPANIPGNYFQDWIMAMPEFNLRLANDHVAGIAR